MQQPPRSSRRAARTSGLTLIEVLIAMVIFTIGALGVAATSATIVRQLAMNTQRDYSASIGGAQSELFHAAPCRIAGSGSAQSRGLRWTWSAEGSAIAAELDHRITRATPLGDRQDRFISGVTCE